jgi:hypothetical protein
MSHPGRERARAPRADRARAPGGPTPVQCRGAGRRVGRWARAAIVAAAVVLLVQAAQWHSPPTPAQAAGYTVKTLVTGLSNPSGVAVDAGGNVYIADTNNNAVKKYDGTTLTTLVSSGLRNPHGVAVDAGGNVYIADTNNNAVKKYDGTALTTLVSGLGNPYGVAVDGSGNVYVTSYSNSELLELLASAPTATPTQTATATSTATPSPTAAGGPPGPTPTRTPLVLPTTVATAVRLGPAQLPTFVPTPDPARGGQVVLVPTQPPGATAQAVVIDRTDGAPFPMTLLVPPPANGAGGQLVRVQQDTAVPTAVALPAGVAVAKVVQVDVYDLGTLTVAVQLDGAEEAVCRADPARIALLHVGDDGALARYPIASLDCATGILVAVLPDTSFYAVATLSHANTVTYRYIAIRLPKNGGG